MTANSPGARRLLLSGEPFASLRADPSLAIGVLGVHPCPKEHVIVLMGSCTKIAFPHLCQERSRFVRFSVNSPSTATIQKGATYCKSLKGAAGIPLSACDAVTAWEKSE